MDVDEENVADAASACKRQKRNNSIDEGACNEEDGGDAATAKSATATTTVENEKATEESVEAAGAAAGDADMDPKLVGRNKTKEENETVNGCNTTNNNNNNKEDNIGQKMELTAKPISPSFFKEITDAIINDICSEDSTSSEEQPAATTSATATSTTAAQPKAALTAEATVGDAVANNAPALSLAIFQGPIPDNLVDSDDADVEQNLTRLNSPSRSQIYTYRSNISSSDSSSTDDTEVDIENVHAAITSATAATPSFSKAITDALINVVSSDDSTSSEEEPAATTSAKPTSTTRAQAEAASTAEATVGGAVGNNVPARGRASYLAIFQGPPANNVVDSNDAEVEQTQNSTRFNRPRSSRTYAYRSNVSHSDSSSTDDTEVENNHVAESNRTRRVRSYIDADDTEVEQIGDGNGDEDEDADGAAAAANNEHESLSPEFPEESSSDSSVAFWNRYYTSSNEDIDSDDDFNDSVANPAEKEQIEINVNKVMCKSKPSYSWNFDQELMQRENQLFNRIGWRGGHTSSQSFGRGYYGSRQVVERLKLLKVMSRHTGCVNCLNFNRFGDLICSGSDDLSIHVWDWANGKPRHSFKSGHSYNIFQTKFIDSAGCLDIVSSSRDGQVRRAVIPPSGSSSIKPMRLYSHNDAVHKLVVVPQSRHEIMSAGEDAAIKHYDLRTNTSTTMLRCVDDKRRVRLFSISHHPYTQEFCISGSDDKLRVYDKRRLPKSVHVMTPKDLKDTKITQITCAVYNHSGSEILASYSDAGIYLYDSRNYQEGEYLHVYEGHINSRTIKGVNFFGPHSEYIVSGSDCGHIFFWDKNTEAVINFMKGDDAGVVNCLEPHPSMPVLATSGLEHKVKIWAPHGGAIEKQGPCTDALKETLQRNFRRSILDVGDFDINQIHYFVGQLLNPLANGGHAAMSARQMGRTHELFASSSSNSSSSSSSGGRIRIRTQRPDAAAQGEEPNRDSNASSSDEGIADPLGCRPQ